MSGASQWTCWHDEQDKKYVNMIVCCVFVYTSVHPLPGLLTKLFPSPVFNANMHLLYVVQCCVTHNYTIATPLM